VELESPASLILISNCEHMNNNMIRLPEANNFLSQVFISYYISLESLLMPLSSYRYDVK